MSRLQSILHRASHDLAELRYSWALVGGLAVSTRTEPRFTSDADAERAIGGLQGRGYRVQAVIEQEATSRLATTRLIPPGEDPSGIVLDVLFASSGIEPEIVAAAETLEVLPGLAVPVATIGHLVALKLLARDDRTRPQDRVDLAALVRAAADSDVEQARLAVALIHGRGFPRVATLPGPSTSSCASSADGEGASPSPLRNPPARRGHAGSAARRALRIYGTRLAISGIGP